MSSEPPPPPPDIPGGGVFDDYPVDRKSCQLLGPTALVVQGLMGVLVISSLVYKRHREKPKRPWRIWLFDVSKQVVGQMFVHGVNVFISDVGSARSSGNACVFYFLNILIDTTLGVGAIYLTLHLLTWFFTTRLQLKGFQSGQYGSPPSLNYWARQAIVYVVSLTSMKLLVVLLLASWHRLLDIGAWMLSWLGNSDTAQVVLCVFPTVVFPPIFRRELNPVAIDSTMGLFPILMNVIQFWLIDSIVKAGGFGSTALTSDPFDPTDREPLFRSSADLVDDDDDNGANSVATPTPAKGDIEAQGQVRHLRRSTDSSHTYPPSLNDSSTAASAMYRHSQSPPPDPHGVLSARRHRPPAALRLSRSPMLNFPDPTSEASAGTEDWHAWNGDNDWVDEEEERTARQAERVPSGGS
ncbi:vacuolar membrane protein-domain-containing protein [Russula earlei]|uniref:Vacuolar membrane protein-domain-containing protein n=1 Tax=Russula earlei TaxID=71964 RepID=A0ACC0U6Z8_9AGAM|nr:vacuolar membrane protein-domain-containing protein [Russula earlei]